MMIRHAFIETDAESGLNSAKKRTMQTYELQQFGTFDGLIQHERPTPQAGAGQILVKVHARSLNFRDLLIVKQRYAVPARAGVVPLSDGAGEVVALGAGVTTFALGDRVTATYFPLWQDGRLNVLMGADQFGCTRDGMLAEYVLLDASSAVKLPAHLSFNEACTLPCAGVTAWNALVGGRALAPGDVVLTIGTGGVALFALQFAKLFGARVVAVTSSEQKAALLRGMGADEVVNRTVHADWATEVRKLTQGRGVDHVVETGSIETLPHSLAACAANAELALVAALGEGYLNASALRGLVTIRRVFVGSKASFETMNRAISQHQLHPVIDSVFPFAEARLAYAHFEAKQHVGKVVIADTGVTASPL
ncbi:zinc-dependent alcohol dehydrogenase family protein [Duganella rhizosphaerae]|uniref:zinc-dependent alcohol dehydrogenase family protein n=1 Tax=Duganella rhizosphaerae TaxID=2885763 RepID=UPI00403FA155